MCYDDGTMDKQKRPDALKANVHLKDDIRGANQLDQLHVPWVSDYLKGVLILATTGCCCDESNLVTKRGQSTTNNGTHCF